MTGVRPDGEPLLGEYIGGRARSKGFEENIEFFDLVYSGQSIEHVTPSDADIVIKEVARVLRPGGWFALDTPNARVTRVQQPDLIDPDIESALAVLDGLR